MFSRLHNRLGTAGFVLAIVALVAAVAGTAFAATGLNSKQKKEVKSIAKKIVKQEGGGPAGPAGPAGLNGGAGAAGPQGAPWPAGGTLPSGSTETGAWSEFFENEGVAAISFPIPLASALDSGHVKKVGEEEAPPAQCDNGSGASGSAANPEADPGFLCVFVTTFEGENGKIVAGGILDPGTVESGAGRFGASVLLGATGAAFGVGSFAVTAP